jgi:hypothetical protein
MKDEKFMMSVRYAALAGNIFFILWVTANAAKNGFNGTIYEKLSYVLLMILLVTNIVLLVTNNLKRKQIIN